MAVDNVKVVEAFGIYFVWLDDFGVIAEFDSRQGADQFVASQEAKDLIRQLHPYIGRFMVGYIEDTLVVEITGCESSIPVEWGTPPITMVKAIVSGMFDEEEVGCKKE